MTEQVKKRIYLYSLNNVISKIELVNVAKFYAIDFLFDSIEDFLKLSSCQDIKNMNKIYKI